MAETKYILVIDSLFFRIDIQILSQNSLTLAVIMSVNCEYQLLRLCLNESF